MDNNINNDFEILDNVLKNIENKYIESKTFFEENLQKKYFSLDFSTNIKSDGIEIYYIFSQNLENDINNIIKYSFSKKDSEREWKFETKIIKNDIAELSIQEYDEIKSNIPSLDSLNLIKRTKEKRVSNLRGRNRPEIFNLDFNKIKEKLYQNYFSLKNKHILISDVSEVKYSVSSNLIQFYFIKNLYFGDKKIGTLIIKNSPNLLNDREIYFEIEYDKNKISISERDNQYLLRNNYFLRNIFSNFEKILVDDNDLIFNYYKKNLLIFNRKKLDLNEIRGCFYNTVADSKEQAKSIMSEEGK